MLGLSLLFVFLAIAGVSIVVLALLIVALWDGGAPKQGAPATVVTPAVRPTAAASRGPEAN